MKAERLRAGFWRRTLSFFLDYMVVIVPFQLIAVVLFALTAGMVQFTAGGVTADVCYKATGIPGDLKPPPPANFNVAQVCKTTLFGAETARWLTVARVTQDGNTKYSISERYALDRHDQVIDAWSLNWIAYLVLLAYLVAFKLRKGSTLGDRALKISVVDNSLKTNLPPPFKQMAIRYAVLLGPFLVTAAIMLILARTIGTTAEDMAKYHYIAATFALMAPALIYYFIALVQIGRKTDPFWDRAAMTAVVRREPNRRE
ncbi:MAG: RDD family protein [Afipia sp.]|nr:RDD family protein [Afipia sp.]